MIIDPGFPPLFVLQVTKAGRGGLGTKLGVGARYVIRFIRQVVSTHPLRSCITISGAVAVNINAQL